MRDAAIQRLVNLWYKDFLEVDLDEENRKKGNLKRKDINCIEDFKNLLEAEFPDLKFTFSFGSPFFNNEEWLLIN